MSDPISLTQLRAKAESIREIIQDGDAPPSWPYHEVLALIDTAEAARLTDFAITNCPECQDAGAAGHLGPLRETLARYTTDQ